MPGRGRPAEGESRLNEESCARPTEDQASNLRAWRDLTCAPWPDGVVEGMPSEAEVQPIQYPPMVISEEEANSSWRDMILSLYPASSEAPFLNMIQNMERPAQTQNEPQFIYSSEYVRAEDFTAVDGNTYAINTVSSWEPVFYAAPRGNGEMTMMRKKIQPRRRRLPK